MRFWVWNDKWGKGDVGVMIGVHEVYERMGVWSSRVVTGRDGNSLGCFGGDDWCINFIEGNSLIDYYMSERSWEELVP